MILAHKIPNHRNYLVKISSQTPIIRFYPNIRDIVLGADSMLKVEWVSVWL